MTPTNTITCYQCAGQSLLRPEMFLIYYYFFRHKDKHPTPDIIGLWRIKEENNLRS